MSKTVWLLGTRHDFHGLAPAWIPTHVREFVNRCAEIVSEFGLTAVGEEASQESIGAFAKDAFGGSSALGQWCDSRGLHYLAFDLTDEECIRLGIPDSLSSKRAENEGDMDLAQRLSAERFNEREVEWIRRLSLLDSPSLLVLGAWHVASMQEKLAADGWDVSVVDDNWTPSDALSNDIGNG
ncbi:hypothetical protein [Lysobacter gummosus]|uniref:TraB family protein n=1 Tax=Lysobacter gummosus TaxID=262324 RepID=A0ABY3XGH5_9GAMM|nr:hypothetical protein [Lysobacter gummosus]UNP30729.1 hypothetical protein MOV92_05585 [Lysobacter gummosus]